MGYRESYEKYYRNNAFRHWEKVGYLPQTLFCG